MLGLVFALKMVAYVGIAPAAEAVLSRLSRKAVLIGLDFGRMVLLVPMALVTEPWHVVVLAFLFFGLAAAFTPLYHATVPDILTDEPTYTRALALSRIAYTLEAVLSPVVAAALLQFLTAEALFVCASLAFAGSIGSLVATPVLGRRTADRDEPARERLFRGMRIYTRTPRLRGLLLLNFSLALVMAWILVNSVVYAGIRLGDAEAFYPLLMAGFGLGAAGGAVLTPRLVESTGERQVIVAGAVIFALAGGIAAFPLKGIEAFGLWAVLGMASSLVLTPGGLVLIRSADHGDRPSVFAAHFSLSHAGWLIAYPLAGWLGTLAGLGKAVLILAGLALMTAALAVMTWPRHDPPEREHSHADLPDDHDHLRKSPAEGPRKRHSHVYHIDRHHARWPRDNAR